jgi:hypothetical protein
MTTPTDKCHEAESSRIIRPSRCAYSGTWWCRCRKIILAWLGTTSARRHQDTSDLVVTRQFCSLPVPPEVDRHPVLRSCRRMTAQGRQFNLEWVSLIPSADARALFRRGRAAVSSYCKDGGMVTDRIRCPVESARSQLDRHRRQPKAVAMPTTLGY